MKHHVQYLLYDYLQHALPPSQQDAVETHLVRCALCRAAKSGIEEMIGMVDEASPLGHGRPSANRSEEFWETFAARVDARIDGNAPRRFAPITALRERLSWMFAVRRTAFAVTGGALAVVAVALIFLLSRPHTSAPEEFFTFKDSSAGQPVVLDSPGDTEAAATAVREGTENLAPYSRRREQPPLQYAGGRVGQYLRKSKMLLIGIVNMDTSRPTDLAVEGRASRQLIQEARYLRERPLDPQTAGLVDELDRILIQLAAIAAKKKSPDVEILRGGIHQENLLFKIRMAEVALDTTRYSTTTKTF